MGVAPMRGICLVAVLVSLALLAGGSGTTAAPAARDFRVDGTGTYNTATNTFSATARARPIGNSTLTQQGSVLSAPTFPLNGAACQTFGGSFTLTSTRNSANFITADFVAVACPASAIPFGSAVISITGGGGDFADAGGSAAATGRATSVVGSVVNFEFEMDGTITVP